jgi:hypothetical protein
MMFMPKYRGEEVGIAGLMDQMSVYYPGATMLLSVILKTC